MISFTKEKTTIIKGIAIIFMIIHHCFLAPDRYFGQTVVFEPLNETLANTIALSLKICVSMFVFISAYGGTLSYLNMFDVTGKTNRKVYQIMINRYIKMMAGFYFVFLCVIIYSIIAGKGIYSHAYGTNRMAPLYCLIDFLGLAQLFHTPTILATFWYMSLAQLIIISIPLLYALYCKFGVVLLLFGSAYFAVLFPITTADAMAENTYCFYPLYLFTMAIGIIAADKKIIDKVCNYRIKKIPLVVSKVIKLILYLMIAAILFYYRLKTLNTPILAVWEGLLSLIVICFAIEFISVIPVIKQVLHYIGKHSMNIFLIHNFIRVVWYYEFTYSFKYAGAIVIVLLSISLLISIIIEFIKKITKYNVIIDRIIVKLQNIKQLNSCIDECAKVTKLS